jgi:methionyl-tRNA synthetase
MKPSISYDQFLALDIRMGVILSATAPEWSKKLLRFEVDFGEEIGKRIIFSGIKQWYTPEDFVGRAFPFIINLEPKKMGDEESQGMMMMADGEEKPILFQVTESVQPGTIVR